MKSLPTWGGRSEFEYDGSIPEGTVIYYGSGFKISISSEQYSQLLNHFRGKSVNIGTSRDNPPKGSVGEWLQKNVAKAATASYVGAILIHESYATKLNDGPSIEFKDIYPHESEVHGTEVYLRESNESQKEIEIVRGYEVLPNNNVRFGIRITNNSDAVITDVQVLLDYNESLFSLEGHKVQKLDSIPPTVPRTAKFILKPLGCVHKEFIEATIIYRDHKWEKHIVTMIPHEIHCVCPFLRAKPLTKGEFFELTSNGHIVDVGINFQGVSINQLTTFLMQTCTNRFHKVDAYSINGYNIFYFSSESIGQKAYYLLTVFIKEQEGLTQIMLRAVSDKTYGIYGFLNEIVSELKQMVQTVSAAKEIGVIKHEHVINIIDSVVQRTSFSLDGKASVNVEDSIVQHSQVSSQDKVSVFIKDSIVQNTDFKAAKRETNTHPKPITYSDSSLPNRKQIQSNEKRTESKKKVIFSILVLLFIGGYFIGSPWLIDIFGSSHEDTASEIKYLEPINNNSSSESYLEEPVTLSDTEINSDAKISSTQENIESSKIVDSNFASFSSFQDGLERYTNSIGMEFVLIPAGEFMMGSDVWIPTSVYCGPQHYVTIKKQFYIGKYEVTQKQWYEVMNSSQSSHTGDEFPVESVSWDDVQIFINNLNEKEGTDKYRLPSEAEWEYACRAGTTTNYSFGNDKSDLDEYAWSETNSGGTTHPVGQKKPNVWGVYDMHGNVAEWVQDEHYGSYEGAPTDGAAWEEDGDNLRIIRGGDYWGAWRSEVRLGESPSWRYQTIGFRLVMEA